LNFWEGEGSLKNKKGILTIIAICFICLLAGCQETPEEVIVKQKNQADVADYSKEDNGEITAALSEELLAPETYQDETASDDGSFRLVIDASVDIPEVNRVPVYHVTEKEYTQDFIDTVTETFFGDAPIYDNEEYYAVTKENIAAELAKWKEELAAGNFDLEAAAEMFGQEVITEEEYKGYLQDIIDQLEQDYKDAPETLSKTRVKPGLDTEDWNYGYTVEMDQEHTYNYQIENFNGYSIRIERSYPQFSNMNVFWTEHQLLKNYEAGSLEGSTADMTESEIEALAGIQMEEAKAAADEKVKNLGLLDMTLYDWDYAVLRTSQEVEEAEEEVFKVQDAGYWFYYTRKVSDIPLTYTSDWGGGLESMEDERETWYYERLEILVTDDGIDQVNLTSLYDLGEEEASSVQLLKFAEIMEIFKNMMSISNAEVSIYENKRVCYIDHITLGYMRVYEPNTGSKSGTLIPVWDFFGGFEDETLVEGETMFGKNYDKFQSHLTINAIDGTLIDRGLGY